MVTASRSLEVQQLESFLKQEFAGGTERSLLVCCGAWRGATVAQAAERWPNLTVKKIPKMVKDRCEWGHDDYSLNVANLPMAQTPSKAPLQDDLFGGDVE